MSSIKSLENISQAKLFWDTQNNEVSLYASYFITAAIFILIVYSQRESYPNLPRLNPKKATELTWNGRLHDYMMQSQKLLAEGTQQFPDRPYKLYMEQGDMVVVPTKYAEELKSNRALDFSVVASEGMHWHIPGMSPFKSDAGTTKVVQNYLTKALASLTMPISLEATKALYDVLPQSKAEWAEVKPTDLMVIVSRMSSRIFMGEELCSDMEWIQESSQYVNAAFQGVYQLSQWPGPMRPWVHWFLPHFYEIRRRLKRCRAVLQPHIDRRIAIKKAAAARGEPNPYNDSIEWFSREYSAGYDPTQAQLNLTLVAVHTTSDLLAQTMMDIAKHPEILGPLREETIRVLQTDGLKKSALQKLHLMDACFKESQRMRPVFLAAFRRRALADVTTNDGFVIKKGTMISTDIRRTHFSTDIYQDPSKWNPYRYIDMRKSGQENQAHLVSTSDKHNGFGYGIHACPGRFFAANELKIALAHMLLKYDWKLPEDAKNLPVMAMGSNLILNPATKFLFRRRQEELDLDTLES
ncbi:cytochrome P450 [Colletotrichum navitas]|uniref:Cytochrome P450 n=1 Tax=Colletotrichum navitas TaxID=681940 RepID=A0AAD8UTS1_9PEZI|nr:cytochrome P450 [Colletotrichum navitas]KAK1558225.1 cytochrome P450 [Colletotrichum navitas]